MTPAPRSCFTCVFHALPPELGGTYHVCRLPPDCAPAGHAPDDRWNDDGAVRTYLGTGCDVMRRQGAACGPHAAMWLDAQAHPGHEGGV